jgi:hypothetical protein
MTSRTGRVGSERPGKEATLYCFERMSSRGEPRVTNCGNTGGKGMRKVRRKRKTTPGLPRHGLYVMRGEAKVLEASSRTQRRQRSGDRAASHQASSTFWYSLI